MVLVGLWGIGGGAIIYLAGLQNIHPQLYEAAQIDGAGPWQRFRDVTLPMLTPTLLFVLLTSLIGAFQVFDIAFVLGGGSRGGTSDSLLFYLINLWNEGFRNGRLGYASALALGSGHRRRRRHPGDLPHVRAAGSTTKPERTRGEGSDGHDCSRERPCPPPGAACPS